MIQRGSRTRETAAWLTAVGLALFFGAAGVTKLVGIPRQIALFDAIGAGQWFRYVTGFVELAAALMVLTPRLRAVGMVLLVTISLGAILTLGFLSRPLTNGIAALVISLLLVALRWTEVRWLVAGSAEPPAA